MTANMGFENVTHCIFDMDGLLLGKIFLISRIYPIFSIKQFSCIELKFTNCAIRDLSQFFYVNIAGFFYRN